MHKETAMETITVHTAKPYPIHIGHGLLGQAGEHIASLFPPPLKIAVVTDDHVAPLYGDILTKSLKEAGYHTAVYVFPHGEDAKSLSQAAEIYRFLAEESITRSDLLIALGGGVCGDLCGFCAATWLRGVPFVQIPTTFLAAIDSSVGGKTAVNIREGKNLVGAFWQPSLVLCDIDTLATLSEDIFSDGTAEAIKYGAIFDEALFGLLADGRGRERLEKIIPRCIDLKRQVVEEDERDTGRRQLLNFGHTIGHAIEKQSRFTLSHGKAVAIGMAEITRRTEALGISAPGSTERIADALKTCGLPERFSGEAREWIPTLLGDKKRHGDKLSFVVLEDIGCSRLYPIPVEEVERFICG